MSKYKAVRVEVDGVWFDSKREAAHYQELKMLARSGVISELELQPVFQLIVNGMKVCTYIADFRYKDRDGHMCVEDSKGVRTPVYKLKVKLLEALHQVRVIEV